MVQLLYASTLGSSMLTSEEIEKILHKSRSNNPRWNITGILLYRSQIFIQLLEGDEQHVNSLYDKIKQDKRHSNVTEIARIHGGQRLFSGWDMAFKELDDSFDLKVINEILSWNSRLSRSPSISNLQILKMLSYFREQIDGNMVIEHQED